MSFSKNRLKPLIAAILVPSAKADGNAGKEVVQKARKKSLRTIPIDPNIRMSCNSFTKLGEDLLCETLGNTLCNFVLQKEVFLTYGFLMI